MKIERSTGSEDVRASWSHSVIDSFPKAAVTAAAFVVVGVAGTLAFQDPGRALELAAGPASVVLAVSLYALVAAVANRSASAHATDAGLTVRRGRLPWFGWVRRTIPRSAIRGVALAERWESDHDSTTEGSRYRVEVRLAGDRPGTKVVCPITPWTSTASTFAPLARALDRWSTGRRGDGP